MRAQNSDFPNVCFPCPNGFQTLMRISGERNFKSEDSPCNSNRSSASSTASSPQDHELADQLAFNIEESVVKVGATAQLKRRNSSLSRKKSGLRSNDQFKDSHKFKRTHILTKSSALSETCLQVSKQNLGK
ncbi:hypothetical protein AWC38_SpisGene9967 [Stylophora pistillata]|uniref:Uncharacterized protein n=1 Tax=Stylophora pistillata TaxID=50429 RepID=A0A2B4S3X7_STYPI|nr:hypothetical protein AWC38_SpisGene9967 [Stylophora pistillata]